MKKLILLSLSLLSLQSFAFTSIKIKSDATLNYSFTSEELDFSINANKREGSDYCSVSLTTKEELENIKIPAGTVFELTSIDENECDSGRQCSLGLTAYNLDKNVKLSLFCRSIGPSATKITSTKINKILKNVASVK